MTGLRILVVEDEYLLAHTLEEELRNAGHAVVGPYGDRATGTRAARREAFDLAILDINLGGEMAYPLADELIARKVPFLFLTGYGTLNMPERFRACPRVSKPYEPKHLLREIARVAAGGS